MGFLAPLYLLLAVGAAVPLLVHLLRRRAGARVEFPAVRYLARAEREHRRRFRVRNLLIMLLRAAAVLALALAAARPVTGALGRFATGHVPVAVAVVLDNSLSTAVIEEGHPALDRLKAAAASIIARIGKSDRAWLVTADGVVRSPAALEETAPLAGAGDLARAVERGAALVREAGLPGRVVAIATDGQATAWPSAPVDAGAAAALVFAPGGNPPRNHAVSGVSVEPARWMPDGAVTAHVYSSTGGDSTAYRVVLAGRTVARGVVSATAGSGVNDITVAVAPAERGLVDGAVELDPDELRGDDVRYFAVWIGDPPPVEVDSEVGPFLRGATAALLDAGRLTRAVPGRAAIAVVAADQLTALPALIIAPRDPVRVGVANRALERVGIPWRFGDPVSAASSSGAPLESVSGVPLGDARALRWTSLARQPGGAASDTLVRVDGTAPWAVAGPGYAIVASSLDPAATTLPIRAAFIPWVADLLATRLGPDVRGGALGGVIETVPGATLARPEWAVALEPPNSGGNAVAQALSGPEIDVPPRAGVYFIRGVDGTRMGALVVNPEPSESDLRRLSPGALGRRLRARHVAVYNDAARWVAAIFSTAGERPLAATCLVLALTLLAVEALLARAPGPVGRAA